MRTHLIVLSYSYYGKRGTGPWNGPERYLRAGVEQLLRERGLTVTVEHISFDQLYEDMFQACVASNRVLAREVRRARAEGAFPLILSGTCDSCLGALAGMEHSRMGIVWCDAHGDFNTPATSPSGAFVGMPLAVATGRVYQELWPEASNNAPVADSRVLMVDVRDLDPLERQSVERAAIPIIEVSALQQPREPIASLDEFAADVPDVYFHLDIDVLDPEAAPGVDFRAPGGPSLPEMEQAIATLKSRFTFQAAMLTAYNPDLDQDDKTLQAGLRLLAKIAE